MNRKLIIGIFLLLSFVTVSAQGSEEVPDYDGYLVQLNQPVPMLCDDSGGEIEVVSSSGLYWAATEEAAENAFPKDSIAYIEPNYYVSLLDAPDDPFYGEQWALSMVGAEVAWNRGLDGTGVRIGVIDSGVEEGHEDLQGASILTGYNYLAENQDTGDTVGHGTFVTGIIAAQRGNGTGVAGIAERAEIVPLKCFDAKKSSLMYIVRAIRDGVDVYHCDILNLSFGVTESTETLREAVDYAVEQGAILVAAVGNDGNTTLNYPAAYETVIGVGAITENKERASFSHYNTSVFLTAPGHRVYGLLPDSGYGKGNGTSYSCPMVTAAAALAKQYWQEMTAAELQAVLMESAEDLGEVGWDTEYGHGLLNIPAMLERIQEKRKLRMEREGESLQVRGVVYHETENDLLLWAGQYDENGRFLGVKLLNAQKDAFGDYTVEDSLTVEPTSTVRLFALDENTFQPVKATIDWEGTPAGEPIDADLEVYQENAEKE